VAQPAPLPFDPIAEARRQWVEHGWGEQADVMVLVTSLMRAQQIVLSRVDGVLRPLDLTFARYELLMILSFSKNGSLPLAKLGSRLQVHPTSVTSAVDRLETQGLVVRRPHPTDRRTTLAEITDAGRATAQEATELLNAKVFDQPWVSERKISSLNSSLAELRHLAGDF
jgi:DNA-binding MarR family transcriptional regulator